MSIKVNDLNMIEKHSQCYAVQATFMQYQSSSCTRIMMAETIQVLNSNATSITSTLAICLTPGYL